MYVYVTTLNVTWLKKNHANFATGDIFGDHLWVCILCNFFRSNAISDKLILKSLHYEIVRALKSIRWFWLR